MARDDFKKIDLHVHTPQSACYGEPSASPENIVDAAVAAGLDAIGITDHNTVAAIDDIRNAAEQKPLAIFPGAELSTPAGHFTAIFDVDAPKDMLENFIRQLKIPPEGRGDGAYLIDIPIEVVFKKIIEHNGMVTAAHIERWPSGFLEAKTSRRTKMDIYGSKYLSVLEITISQNRDLWQQGRMKGYPKKYPCIQSSDAHAPEEIGRRFVQIRMDRMNLTGLASAFADPENNIIFPSEDAF